MPTLEHWKATWRALGVPLSPAVLEAFEPLMARYSESHRHYHTTRHLDECFEKLGELRGVAEHPAEVELALWYHDAIYERSSTQNEARSADLAVAQVRTAGGSAESAERVRALILATRHAAVPEGIDAEVLVDVDLSILAADPGRFDEYEAQVREEYPWVPEVLFRRNRKKLLRAFLARASIFSTRRFAERYEARARANLERSIARLGG